MNCSLGDGSFVRLTPRPDDIHTGQSIGLLYRYSCTCIIENINWEDQTVELRIQPLQSADRYRLQSNHSFNVDQFENAMIDESPSDYVAPHVDNCLQNTFRSHVTSWFDPTRPVIPESIALSSTLMQQIENFISSFCFPNGQRISCDQARSIIDGLNSKIHLLQGPPGTGKTRTLSVYLLLRALINEHSEQIIIVTGPTHTAVDTLLEQIAHIKCSFIDQAAENGCQAPGINIAKVHSSNVTHSSAQGIEDIRPGVNNIKNYIRNGVLILGGTTSALLKTANRLRTAATFRTGQNGSFAQTLCVDEASMLLFPHYLALSTLVHQNGNIIVAGDHRQLSPIIAHDWEHEDRPTTVLYQPYVSSFEAIRRLTNSPTLSERSLIQTGLAHSFRLPPEIRNLISRIYSEDNIQLDGSNGEIWQAPESADNPFDQVWTQPTGLFLPRLIDFSA